MESHIEYVLEVLRNEICRIENERTHGHYLREDIEAMKLDIQRLETAVADSSQKFNHAVQ